MNFDQRKHSARKMVVDFLSVLSPPRGLEDKQLATRIIQIADAFARRMPVEGDYEQSVAAVLTRLMDTHQSNTWPPQAAFVMAMPNREISKFSSQQTFEPKSPIELTISRMQAGQAVPETQLWGGTAGHLPREHLDNYRNASVKGWIETHGHKAFDAMVSKYGAVVMPYFPRQSEKGAS
jgi:hypothetical protein